jgi:hypothetical protein
LGKSFLAAFAAVFILWGTIALKIDLSNEHLLSKKVASILFQKESYALLIIITATIGGLVAGMSALTGSLLRKSISDLIKG